MAMDLNEACKHCSATIGDFCATNCSVNGKNIIALRECLKGLDLYYDPKILRGLTKTPITKKSWKKIEWLETKEDYGHGFGR